MSPSASEALAHTLATPLSSAGPVVENRRIELEECEDERSRSNIRRLNFKIFIKCLIRSLSTHGYSIIVFMDLKARNYAKLPQSWISTQARRSERMSLFITMTGGIQNTG